MRTVSLLVLSGPSGAGKSCLAQLLSDRLGWQVRNIGDRLLEALRSEHVDVAGREQIGPAFFAHYAVSDYVRLVTDGLPPDTVLDGLRREEPLAQLHRQFNVLHVHRDPPRGAESFGLPVQDPVRAQAHVVVPWLPDVALLPVWADAIAVLARSR